MKSLISTLKFVKTYSFIPNKKKISLRPKMLHLDVLCSNFEKPFSYLKSAPSSLQCLGGGGGGRIFKKLFSYLKLSPRMSNFKILQKQTKILQFGTKNALFECFGGYNLEKLLSYLKSAPSNLSNYKI